MQVLFSPCSPPPSPPRSSKHPNAHAHRRISFKAGHVSRTLSPNSTASLPTNPSGVPSPHLDVVDLTDSPAPSPCSSNTSLSRSSSLYPSSSRARRSKSPARPYPPPSFIGLPNSLTTSKSTPAFARPTPSVATAPHGINQPDMPHKRAMFILPGDGDSDRDREGEGSSAHDESDDSDRTSFFSAEEYVVSSAAVRDIVNAGGTALDTNEPERSKKDGCDSAELHRENSREERDASRDSEQDAAHGLRRWHALMELVHTEVSYVRDLRVLVNVYLALLPSLPLSGPAYLAVQELTGDASALLVLHERFARALEDASAQAAGGASPSEDVDQAVQKVANLFVDEATTFDLYQRFCATQPDVVRLLRPAQARVEWVAFEQRCTVGGGDVEVESLASRQDNKKQNQSQPEAVAASAPVDTLEPPSKPTSASAPGPSSRAKSPPPRTASLMPSAFKSYAASHRDNPSSQVSEAPSSPRRHSYDSFAGVFGASSSGTARHRPSMARPASDSGRTSTVPPIPQLPNSKLRFYDFLIKPVQRICKYPLMLEGLRSRVRSQGQSADAAVASAVESMRAVATRVDEARRRREIIAKTKLITERIDSHSVVTPEFLSSLGDCLLAGSLDVVHHHHVMDPITAPVRVRYLGAFLFPGGYLLLVKIGKGKAYRIRHWFSLAPFEVVDIPEDIALVSSSFRLSHMDHHFELVAACRREKDLWLRAINEARNAPSTWPLEPLSSLQSLHSDQSATSSISDTSAVSTLEHVGMKRGLSSGNMSESSNPLGILRLSSTRFRHSAPTPPVRYIFSPTDESSILLRRSSEANRIFVDRGLADVLTDLVTSLRKQAQARQEQLFPPPGIAEASQTLAVAAKNKLMGRGTVVMARSRSLLIPGTAEEGGAGQSFTVRPKSTPTRKRMSLLPALSVLYTEPESMDNTSALTHHADLQFPQPDSSSDHSHSHLISRTTTGSRPQTPASAPLERHDSNPHYHRRARSLVGSVRGMMRLGSTKVVPVQHSPEAWQGNRAEDSSGDKGELTEIGSKDSICRRRVSSAPTSPLLSSPNTLSIFIDCDPGSRPPSLSPDASTSPSSSELDPPSPFAPPGAKLFRKKSGSVPPNSDQTLKPRRSFKSFMFYNRLTAVDPA